MDQEPYSFRRKVSIGAAVALILSATFVALIYFLFLHDRGAARGDGNGDASLEDVVQVGEEAAPAPDESAEGVADGEDATADEDEELATREPLLRGTVSGELGAISRARVLLFSMRDIEDLIRRLERFDPGSGIPDIPELIATVKSELNRFRDSSFGALTNEEGVYEFFELAASPYFVLSIASGYVFQYQDVVVIQKGRTAELDIWMDRGATISGRVVDLSGAGVPGVTVTAEFRPPGMASIGRIVQKLLKYVNGEFLKGPFQTLTDADGAFSVMSLPTGIYDLHAKLEGFPETRLHSVTTGTADAVIQLRPGVRIDGALVDASGVPVAGQLVILSPQLQPIALPIPGVNEIAKTVNQLLDEPDLVAQTADDGSFSFKSIGAGNFQLEIKPTGFLPISRVLDVPAEDDVHLGLIALNRGGGLRGWVHDSVGNPIDGARISAFRENISIMTMGSSMQDMVEGRGRIATNADGRFEILGLNAGSYRVLVQAEGFGATAVNDVKTDAEEPVRIVLEPGMDIQGRVIDKETGEPIVDARVSASGVRTKTDGDGEFLLRSVSPRNRDMNPFERGGRDRRSRRRNREGEGTEVARETAAEEMSGTRKRRIGVHAKKEGFQESRELVEFDKGGTVVDVEIALAHEPKIHGITLDPDGNPLPAALVRLVPDGASEIPFIPAGMIFLDASISNLEGQFTLESPADRGRFHVLASHPLYASTPSERFSPTDHASEENPIEVRVKRGASVTGTVTDGSTGIAGATLRLEKKRDIPAQQRFFMNLMGLPKMGDQAFSSRDGTFSYKGVLPGEYMLSAETVGFGDTWSETFTLAEGETREVQIAMNPGGAVAGRVVDEYGEPVPGASVRALREAAMMGEQESQIQRLMGGSFKRATCDQEGHFTLAGMPTGKYTVIAEKAGFSPAEIQQVQPDDESELELALYRSARVRGRVIDAMTAMPLARFEFRLEPEGGEARAAADRPNPFPRFRPWREVRNSEGKFFQDQLTDGTYLIEIRSETFVPASTRITLHPGDDIELAFALMRAGRLVGRVLDSVTGLPVAGVRIGLAAPRSDPEPEEAAEIERKLLQDPGTALGEYYEERALGENVESDADGQFAVESFPAEARTVVATHEDYIQEHQKSVEVTLGEEHEIKILLRRGLEVSGTVTDVSGSSARGAFVLIRGADATTHRVSKNVRADSQGRFKIKGLSPGRYVIIANGRRGGGRGDSQSTTLSLSLEEESVEEVSLRLRGGG